MSQGIPQPPPPPPTYGKNGGGSAAIWIVLLLGGGVLGLFCCGGAGLVGFFFVGVRQTQQEVARLEAQAMQAQVKAQAESVRVGVDFDQEGSTAGGTMGEFGTTPLPETTIPTEGGYPTNGLGGPTESPPSGETPMVDNGVPVVTGAPGLGGLTDEESNEAAGILGFGPAEASDFVGEWVSVETSSIYTIALVDGQPRLESVVGDDGERFQVVESNWDSGSLTWRYRVPSTDYSIRETVSKMDAKQLFSLLTSSDPGGNETISVAVLERKSGGRPAALPNSAAELIVGDWLDEWSQAVYTISLVDGQPRLTSASSGVLGMYIIVESNWDGSVLRGRISMPSTDQMMNVVVNGIEATRLTGTLDWTGPVGGGNDVFEWTRRSAGPLPGAVSPAETLVGEWLDDSTQAVYTIAQVDGQPTLTSVVSSGGEVFPIAQSTWNGTTLNWQFRMPSTGHTMIETVWIEATRLTGTYTWSLPDGSTGAGNGSWTRRGAAPAAPQVVGEWVDSATQAVYTIAQVNGQPTLTSAIDDNGEVYEIQESVWDGSTLRWRIRIPSSGYTLTEFPSDVRPNEINGTYTWVDANGGTGEGSSTWVRKAR